MPIASQALSHVFKLPSSRLAQSLILAWAALLLAPAHAARPVDEVAQLLEQGKTAQAAKQADDYLRQNPGDVEMRFLRGVIATEQKENAQAIQIFSALTRDYPNLPEPYNNLAVLYAADGQERKAADVLGQAIRTSPSYTTAYENLGDLYARMASDAYAKALQFDGSRQAIAPKLALITQIVPGGQVPGRSDTVQSGGPLPAARPTLAPKPDSPSQPKEAPLSVAKAAPPLPAPQPAVVTPAAAASAMGAQVSEPLPRAAVKTAESPPAPPPIAKPAPAPKPSVAQATPKPTPSETKPTAASAAVEVEAAVKAWAAAWARQDMSRYLAAYSEGFTPPNGGSLAAWKEMRRQRIVGKDKIEVQLRNLKASVNGDQATASFRQNYAAGRLKATTRKTLTLRREKGQWRIVREVTGR